jgi:hypothetical protein
MSDRTHQAKGDHIQQLQQQVEAWVIPIQIAALSLITWE